MDFFFHDPFDDLSKIQSHLAQLQREMDTAQQKRRCNRGSENPEKSTEDEAQKKDLTAGHSEEEAADAWWPAVDVRETGRGYELYVELPGVRKEDVKIELHKEGSGKCLVVSGKKERIVLPPPEEKKDEKEEEGEEEEWHMSEREYGYFERAFSVPVETEGDEIKAKFEDGVLAVSFPKHEAPKTPSKVTVQID